MAEPRHRGPPHSLKKPEEIDVLVIVFRDHERSIVITTATFPLPHS